MASGGKRILNPEDHEAAIRLREDFHWCFATVISHYSLAGADSDEEAREAATAFMRQAFEKLACQCEPPLPPNVTLRHILDYISRWSWPVLFTSAVFVVGFLSGVWNWVAYFYIHGQ